MVLVVGAALLDVLKGELVGFGILLAGLLEVAEVPRAHGVILVADVGAVKDRLGVFRLDGLQKVPDRRRGRHGALEVLEHFGQDGIVGGVHPEVEVLGHIVGILDKEVAHPFIIALAPHLQLFGHGDGVGVVLAHDVDLPVQFGEEEPAHRHHKGGEEADDFFCDLGHTFSSFLWLFLGFFW